MVTTKKLTDESLMLWGKYKGDKMINVPASYLMWLFDNNKCSNDIKQYIIENEDVLLKEIKEQ